LGKGGNGWVLVGLDIVEATTRKIKGAEKMTRHDAHVKWAVSREEISRERVRVGVRETEGGREREIEAHDLFHKVCHLLHHPGGLFRELNQKV